MPAARVSMKKIREVLRLKAMGRTHREIATACDMSPSTVGECVARCRREGLSWPLPEHLCDSDVSLREAGWIAAARLRLCEEGRKRWTHRMSWCNWGTA